MPEQQSLAIEPAAPATPVAAPKTPVKGRYELPAASKPEPKPSPASPEPTQNTPVEATEAQPAEGDKPEEEVTPEQAAKREGRRFERKLDKAYRKAAEAEARAKLYETQLNELKTPKAAQDAGAPKLEQFDYDPEKYAEAKAEYTKKLAEKDWESKQRTAEQTKQRDRLLSSWDEKVEKANDKYDDFATIVGELQPTSPLITAIMESEPDVAYYLGKNPKEAERIANLGQIAQIREIGKLEAKLAAEPEKPKAPSKAPEPIKPLSGVQVASDVPSEKDSMSAWMKKRNKQVHGKNR
jgi:hypothetical protein